MNGSEWKECEGHKGSVMQERLERQLDNFRRTPCVVAGVKGSADKAGGDRPWQ